MDNIVKTSIVVLIVLAILFTMGLKTYAETGKISSIESQNLEETISEDTIEVDLERKEDLVDTNEDISAEGEDTESVIEDNSLTDVDNDLDEAFETEKKDEIKAQRVEALEYSSDTDVFRLTMSSQNDNAETIFTWLYEGNIYIALVSHRGVTELNYNGYNVPIDTSNVKRAITKQARLKIDGIDYEDVTKYASKDNPHNRWSVVKIADQILTSPFTVTIKTELGEGHDVVNLQVYIDSYLEVHHKYDEVDPIFDNEQSGELESDFSYRVHPRYEKDGITYELVDIKIYYNNILQTDKGIGDLSGGFLSGFVPTTIINGKPTASAKIIFVYERIDDGEIRITKTVQSDRPEDANKEFDIFIYGPEGREYVVSLKPGATKTLKGLKHGSYRVSEVVPMNFKLVRISNNPIVLSKTNKIASVNVINKRVNDGWFEDEYTKKNNFFVTGG